MALVGFKMTGDWKKLRHAFDSKVFKTESRAHLERATKLNGLLGVRRVRETMNQESLYKENAPLTVALKKSTKPLIDTGDLRKAITSKIIDAYTVFVGVLSTNKTSNIAKSLHEGIAIFVSEKMRNMFKLLWLKYQLSLRGKEKELNLTGQAKELWNDYKGPWYRIRRTKIVIKPRRFLKLAFENKKFHNLAKQNWIDAVNSTLRELAR